MAEIRPPQGTGRAGRALWSSVMGTYALEEYEVQLLRQLVVVADRVEELDRVVNRDGVLLGDRIHPGLIECRLQRLALARLLQALRLPDQEENRPQRRGGFRTAYRLRQVNGDG